MGHNGEEEENVRWSREPLTLGLDERALVKGHVRREEVDTLGGNDVRHGVWLGVGVGV